MTAMKQLLIVLFATLATNAVAQRYEYVYRDANDSTVNCYLKVIPEQNIIKGLIVRDYSELPDTSKASPYQFTQLAADNGLMTLYTVTSTFFPEMYYTDSCMYILDEIIAEVIREHRIPGENIFMGGLSASGTRALRFAQFCAQGKSKNGLRINGVFSVDSPLDLERFYYSVSRNSHHFKHGMLWEAKLMSRVFSQKLGGSPAQFPDNYLKASVFSATDSLGGNVVYLKNVNVLLFHEPDIDWWLYERGASFYDINSIDITALYLTLRRLGNENAELVTTTGKGFDRNGKRNCHSWTIVDENLLVRWILDRLE